MIIVEKYDKETLIDECWYDSSDVYYSKCYDKKDDYKDLEVTFKDGRTYKYYNLIIQDYLLFKNGGLDNSHGKAFNKFIKKYKFEKINNVDIDLLNNKKFNLLEEKRINDLEKQAHHGE